MKKGTEMRVVKDYGLVRVVSTGKDPRVSASDIQVEVRDSNTDNWEFYCGFNSISDDYAYTNAMEAAGQAIAGIAKRKATLPYEQV